MVYAVYTVEVRWVCANIVYGLCGVEDVPPFVGVSSYNAFNYTYKCYHYKTHTQNDNEPSKRSYKLHYKLTIYII